MIDCKKIDKAFDFYNINIKYKKTCYECIEEINNDDICTKKFNEVYNKLYYDDFKNIKELWNIRDINKFFIYNVNPFITNIMIILGYEIHIYNMKKNNFDDEQVNIHKRRIKECFESDIVNRGYKGIRISQMLWAIYFIRTRIIEVGRLQYEYNLEDDNKLVIKIHIPRGSELDIFDVKKSISDSKIQLKKYFNIENCRYICNSWLLSNKIYEIIDKKTNICKFHELFSVKDGQNCINQIDECDDYSLLPENTSLQKKIKKQLLIGNIFYLGLGELK